MSIHIDARAMTKFAAACRKMSPSLALQMRRKTKSAGEIVAAEVRSRAGFSSRIPGATKTSTAGGRVTVTVDRAKAPNAAPIENGGKGNVTHPTFGHAPNTNKNSPPAFFYGSLAAKADEAEEGIAEAVEETVRALIVEAKI